MAEQGHLLLTSREISAKECISRNKLHPMPRPERSEGTQQAGPTPEGRQQMNVMRSCTRLRAVASCTLVLMMATPSVDAAEGTTGAESGTRDASAMAALDRMGNALRALKKFSLTSDTSRDIVLGDGQKITLDGQVTYRVQQPDRMFVETRSDRRLRQLFYDGNSLTIFAPKLKYYASVDRVNKTLAELAVTAATDYGISFPLTDLFFWGTEYVSRDVLTSAIYVGPGSVDGERVEHYAFRQPGVDWQIWLSEASDLPRKIVITSLEDPAMPQYQARLQWDLQAPIDARSFIFAPSEGVARIQLVSSASVEPQKEK